MELSHQSTSQNDVNSGVPVEKRKDCGAPHQVTPDNTINESITKSLDGEASVLDSGGSLDENGVPHQSHSVGTALTLSGVYNGPSDGAGDGKSCSLYHGVGPRLVPTEQMPGTLESDQPGQTLKSIDFQTQQQNGSARQAVEAPATISTCGDDTEVCPNVSINTTQQMTQRHSTQNASYFHTDTPILAEHLVTEPTCLNRKFLKGIRIHASEDQVWLALTGHGPDLQRVGQLDFSILSVIAASGAKGIAQHELVRISGQDKRSLPHRTDRLHEAGYIEKRNVTVLLHGSPFTRKMHTSLCTLKRWTNSTEHEEELARLEQEVNKKETPKKQLRAKAKRKKALEETRNAQSDLSPCQQESELVGEVSQTAIMAQWSADDFINKQIYDVIHGYGSTGVTLPELRDALFGDEYKKPIEYWTGRMVDAWQVSQPLHLRHLAIVRDTVLKAKSPVYIHYTVPNFQKLVDKGTASWDAVTTISPTIDVGLNVSSSLQSTPQVDEFGFPQLAVESFHGTWQDATLSECAAQAELANETPMRKRHSAFKELEKAAKISLKKASPRKKRENQHKSSEPEQHRLIRQAAVNLPESSEIAASQELTTPKKPRGRPRKVVVVDGSANTNSMSFEGTQQPRKRAEETLLSKLTPEIERHLRHGRNPLEVISQALENPLDEALQAYEHVVVFRVKEHLNHRYAGGPTPAPIEVYAAPEKVAPSQPPKGRRRRKKAIAPEYHYLPSVAAHTLRLPGQPLHPLLFLPSSLHAKTKGTIARGQKHSQLQPVLDLALQPVPIKTSRESVKWGHHAERPYLPSIAAHTLTFPVQRRKQSQIKSTDAGLASRMVKDKLTKSKMAKNNAPALYLPSIAAHSFRVPNHSLSSEPQQSKRGLVEAESPHKIIGRRPGRPPKVKATLPQFLQPVTVQTYGLLDNAMPRKAHPELAEQEPNQPHGPLINNTVTGDTNKRKRGRPPKQYLPPVAADTEKLSEPSLNTLRQDEGKSMAAVLVTGTRKRKITLPQILLPRKHRKTDENSQPPHTAQVDGLRMSAVDCGTSTSQPPPLVGHVRILNENSNDYDEIPVEEPSEAITEDDARDTTSQSSTGTAIAQSRGEKAISSQRIISMDEAMSRRYSDQSLEIPKQRQGVWLARTGTLRRRHDEPHKMPATKYRLVVFRLRQLRSLEWMTNARLPVSMKERKGYTRVGSSEEILSIVEPQEQTMVNVENENLETQILTSKTQSRSRRSKVVSLNAQPSLTTTASSTVADWEKQVLHVDQLNASDLAIQTPPKWTPSYNSSPAVGQESDGKCKLGPLMPRHKRSLSLGATISARSTPYYQSSEQNDSKVPAEWHGMTHFSRTRKKNAASISDISCSTHQVVAAMSQKLLLISEDHPSAPAAAEHCGQSLERDSLWVILQISNARLAKLLTDNSRNQDQSNRKRAVSSESIIEIPAKASLSRKFTPPVKRQKTDTGKIKIGRLSRKGGTTAMIRKEIIMDLVHRAEGVCPSYKELSVPFTVEWNRRGQPGQPETKTVRTAINELVSAGKLRQLTFHFKTDTGYSLTRSMLILPSVDTTDPKVRQVQKEMQRTGSRSYMPEAWLFATGDGDGVAAGRSMPVPDTKLGNQSEHYNRLQHHRNVLEKQREKQIEQWKKEDLDKVKLHKRLTTIQDHILRVIRRAATRKRLLISKDDAQLTKTMDKTARQGLRNIRAIMTAKQKPAGVLSQGTFRHHAFQNATNQTWSIMTLSRAVNLRQLAKLPKDVRTRRRRIPEPLSLRPIMPRLELEDNLPTATIPAAVDIARCSSSGISSSDESDSELEELDRLVLQTPPRSRMSSNLAPQRRSIWQKAAVAGASLVITPRERVSKGKFQMWQSGSASTRQEQSPPKIASTAQANRYAKKANKKTMGMSGLYTGVIPSYMDPMQVYHIPTGTFSASFNGLMPVVISSHRKGYVTKSVQAYHDHYQPHISWKESHRERSIHSIAMKTRFDVGVDRLEEWELRIPRAQDALYPRWTYIHYQIPHLFESADMGLVNIDDGIMHIASTRTGRLSTKPLSLFLEGRHPTNRLESTPKAPLFPSNKRLRSPSPLSGQEEQVSANGEIDERQRRKHQRRANQQTPGPLGCEEEQRLIMAVVSVRCLAGGIEQKCNWSLVIKAMGGSRDEWDIKAKFKSIQDRDGSLVDRTEGYFQQIFSKAYDDDAVPAIDYQHLEAYPWKHLVDWALENKECSSALTILPTDRSMLSIQPLDVDSAEHDINRFYELDTPIFTRERKAVLNRHAWSQPLHRMPPQPRVDDSSLAVARTWVRANVVASPLTYDAALARSALLKFSDLTLERALSSLLRDKIITQSNQASIASNRTFNLHEPSLSKMRKTIEVSDLRRAAWFKAYLDVQFATKGSLVWSPHAQNGEAVAIFNLLANKRITLRTQDVPLNKWGQADGGYQTRRMDKTKLFCNAQILPNATYEDGNPLLPLLPPPAMHLEEEMHAEQKIPLWYDIHGNLVSELWELVITAVLCVVHTRPGIATKNIAKTVEPMLEEWEVTWALEWMAEAGVGVERDTSSGKRYRTKEWWWLVLGSGEEDAEAFAEDGLWPAIEVEDGVSEV